MAVADLPREERALVRQISKVKVLSIEDAFLNQEVDLYDEYYHQIRSQKGYEDLVVVRENNEKVGILGLFKVEIIKELIIIVGGDENALIYIRGNLNPQTINDMIDNTSNKMGIRKL